MSNPQPIKIAILALGGEGGGVLADPCGALLRQFFAERRRHQRVLGRADRNHREGIAPTRQPAIRRNRAHIASGQFDGRAQCFQSFEVNIDRAVADGATAGK